MSATFSRSFSTSNFEHLEAILIKHLGRSATQVLIKLQNFLRQSRNLIDGVYWVYNTYTQWKDQIPGLSIRTLQRVMAQLESLGIIHTKRYEAHRWYQRKWYTIDYDRLKALINPISPKNPEPESRPPSRQNGDIINKDISSKKNIEITNTPLIEPISVNPSTLPVLKIKELDKGDKGLHPLQTGDNPIKENLENLENLETLENPEIKDQGSPKTPRVKPKLKSQNTSDSEIKTDSWCAALAPEIEAQIVLAIAPAPLNQNLRKQVLAVQTEVILDAIAVVEQQKANGKTQNPAGLLMSAIKHKWKPNPPKERKNPSIPDDFNEWFALASKAGLAIGSQIINGVLCVYTGTHQWEPLDDFRVGFSLPWLKRRLNQPHSPSPTQSDPLLQ